MLCRDRCGYCTFAKPPARVTAAYLSLEQVLQVARAGAEAGCHEALFTLGEQPELRYPAAAAWLSDHGFASTVDYLAECCRLVTAETGLLAHANAGALSTGELARLREVAVSQGMMLRVPQSDPGMPPSVAGQDTRPPPGDTGGGRPTPDRVHDRDPRGDR